MITEVILGLVNIVDVDVYLFYSFKGLASQPVPFPYGLPASLFYLSSLSVQLHGGPLWGELAGSLNLYDETGVEHEKNVGRPRAAAVAAGGIIELSYFTLVRSSPTFVRSKPD